MNASGPILRPLALAGSVLLVIALGIVALLSLRDGLPGEGADEEAVDEPEGPSRPYVGNQVEVGDERASVSVGCAPSQADGDVYSVVILNQGQEPTDYVVAAELTADGGDPVEAVVEAADVAPGEQRELVLEEASAELDSPTDCVITAIEADRQIFLTGG